MPVTIFTAENLVRLLQKIKTVFATKTELGAVEEGIADEVSDQISRIAGADFVHTSGNETISGTKTFSSTIAGSVNGSSASCTGNAATATKFAESKAVTLTGAVTGTASSNAGWTISTRLKTFRGCLESEAKAECYFKIASGTITGAYNHHDLVILIQNIVSGYGSGFWNLHLFSGATAGVLNSGVSRLSNSINLNKDRFFLVYKNESGVSVKYELWTYLPERYTGYRFTVISEASRTGKTVADLLTVVDADTGGGSEELPSDYTVVATTYGTTSGDIAGNAATVTGSVGTSALSWNTETTLCTIGGHEIKAKLPANPNTNTTYTFATGDANGQIKVTPSGGSAQNIAVKGLGTAAYTASSDYAASGHTHSYLPLGGGNLTGAVNSSSYFTANGYYIKNASVTKGSNPASGTTNYWTFGAEDKDGINYTNNCIGMFETSLASSGLVKTYIRAMKNTAATATPCELGVAYDTANSTGYTWAPTPATADNSTKIATTAFVKAQGYITSSGSITGSSGSCTGNAATATKLATARSLKTKLDSTTAVTFDGSAAQDAIPVTGTLPVANGGTGQTSIANIQAGKDGSGNTITSTYVNLTGTQTISGAKYYTTDYYRKDTGAVKGTAPSANRWQNGVRFVDNNNVAFGGVERGFLSDGTNRINMIVYKGTTTDTSTNSQIGVGFDKDGNWFTYAPTPATADNSTKIATTAFVKAQGYLTSQTQLSLTNSGSGNAVTGISVSNHAITVTKGSTFLTSHQSLDSCVKTSGDQTVGGAKTFTSAVTLKNTTLDHASVPSSNQYINLYMKDKNNTSWGRILYYANSSDNGGSRGISIDLSYAGSSLMTMISCSVNTSGKSTIALNNAATVFRPSAAGCALGANSTAQRWGQIYSSATSISTSDERAKTQVSLVPDNVLDAWSDVSWSQFKMKDSVAEKGNDARYHNGVIAQQIDRAFKNHGLNASDYGLFCYDEWEKDEDQYDNEGNLIYQGQEAGNIYSVRYEEALCMEASYQRRRADRLESRMSAVEAELQEIKRKLGLNGQS